MQVHSMLHFMSDCPHGKLGQLDRPGACTVDTHKSRSVKRYSVLCARIERGGRVGLHRSQVGSVRPWFFSLPPSDRRSPVGVRARVGRGGLVGNNMPLGPTARSICTHITDAGFPPSDRRSSVGSCARVNHRGFVGIFIPSQRRLSVSGHNRH